VEVPDVRYARAGGVAIAYQVVGDGPQTLVFSPHLCDLFTIWLNPSIRSFLDALANEARLVVFSPRGTGLSDRPRNVTLEARMDDIAAVLDDLGSPRASLFGISTSANACALFAATYPDRVERLVLAAPFPRAIRDQSYPWGLTEEEFLDWLRTVRDRWGDLDFLEEYGAEMEPTATRDPEVAQLFVWQHRLALSPGAAADWVRMVMQTDIVDILGAIRVPTLVLHRAESSDRGEGLARFVASRITNAMLVELRAEGGSPFSSESAEAILGFLRGEALPAVPDSVLATVLFTDIVGSTSRAAALGDKAWSDLLGRHHADVRRELALHRGEEVDTAGDGFFCRFDGPARAIACASRIVAGAREHELEVRAGVHTGECELVGEKIAGIAVVAGARISSLAGPGEVLVSRTVKDLVAGSGFVFDDRGEHELKGVPGAWSLYAARAAA
jgi:class 3 adenylate cyclase